MLTGLESLLTRTEAAEAAKGISIAQTTKHSEYAARLWLSSASFLLAMLYSGPRLPGVKRRRSLASIAMSIWLIKSCVAQLQPHSEEY
jgi:hypothetical protein